MRSGWKLSGDMKEGLSTSTRFSLMRIVADIAKRFSSQKCRTIYQGLQRFLISRINVSYDTVLLRPYCFSRYKFETSFCQASIAYYYVLFKYSQIILRVSVESTLLIFLRLVHMYFFVDHFLMLLYIKIILQWFLWTEENTIITLGVNWKLVQMRRQYSR